jgi:hypothetical protein
MPIILGGMRLCPSEERRVNLSLTTRHHIYLPFLELVLQIGVLLDFILEIDR